MAEIACLRRRRRIFVKTAGTGFALRQAVGGGAMAYVHTLVGFVEHALFVMAGFILMVIGLAMGVTLVMLPVGLVVGLIGFAMFVGGLFVRNLQR
jgi:hypothetical protein